MQTLFFSHEAKILTDQQIREKTDAWTVHKTTNNDGTNRYIEMGVALQARQIPWIEGGL